MLKAFSQKLRDSFFTIKMAALCLFVSQFCLWFFQTKNINPSFTITPNVPTKNLVKALSLGDEQFYFRMLGQKIQNAGDSYRETVALKDHNYNMLYKWFTFLDTIDSQSQYIPFLASAYFSSSQNPQDVYKVVDYLVGNASINPKTKWFWYASAAHIASSKLHNKSLAIRISSKILSIEASEIPTWARLMSIFLAQDNGDYCSAAKFITELNKNQIAFDEITSNSQLNDGNGKYNFMRDFILKRLQTIKNTAQSNQKCP